ncbi:MAG: hypothetical protein IKS42_07250 [Oscillospiraceae bacterium]|nr:hypothetical protein [Oscillospiraceae bacterium]
MKPFQLMDALGNLPEDFVSEALSSRTDYTAERTTAAQAVSTGRDRVSEHPAEEARRERRFLPVRAAAALLAGAACLAITLGMLHVMRSVHTPQTAQHSDAGSAETSSAVTDATTCDTVPQSADAQNTEPAAADTTVFSDTTPGTWNHTMPAATALLTTIVPPMTTTASPATTPADTAEKPADTSVTADAAVTQPAVTESTVPPEPLPLSGYIVYRIDPDEFDRLGSALRAELFGNKTPHEMTVDDQIRYYTELRARTGNHRMDDDVHPLIGQMALLIAGGWLTQAECEEALTKVAAGERLSDDMYALVTGDKPISVVMQAADFNADFNPADEQAKIDLRLAIDGYIRLLESKFAPEQRPAGEAVSDPPQDWAWFTAYYRIEEHT